MKKINNEFLRENWNDLKISSKFNFFKQTIYNSITYNDINLALRMEDRNCMSFGIENRVPFLDHKFVEYIFSIKYENFVKDGIQKYMLRESIRNFSDEFLVNREKKSEACELVSTITGDNSREVVSFGTEAGLFQEIGISTVVCGPGSIEQAHKVDEFVTYEQLKKCLIFLDGIKNS